jgi:hypothetical protein
MYCVYIFAVILHDDSASACCEALLYAHPKDQIFGLEAALGRDPELLATYTPFRDQKSASRRRAKRPLLALLAKVPGST